MERFRAFRTTRDYQNLQKSLPGWYRITNQAAAGPAQVSIYEEIGFLGVSADSFMRDLAGVDGDIEMHINSPGGDVFDGIAIYNQLRQRPGSVSVVIDGIAASAASFVAQAASPGKLGIAPHASMMIHDGFAMCIGNPADMRKLADELEKASDNIAGIYADRTGKPASYWRDLMRTETWLYDKDAVAEGIADYIVGKEQPRNNWDLSVYKNAPDAKPARQRKRPKDVKKPHGDVPYADPGYLDADGEQVSKSGKEGVARYPVDAEHVQAAWSYINQEDNAGQYTPEQLASIKSKIKSAMAQHGHEVSSDNLSEAEILAMFARELDQLDAGKEQ